MLYSGEQLVLIMGFIMQYKQIYSKWKNKMITVPLGITREEFDRFLVYEDYANKARAEQAKSGGDPKS